MAVTVKRLRSYMKNGLNFLLEGPHGTGKTSMIIQACEAEGYKYKLFNAATVDVYTDFTGVPVPEADEKGRKYLQFVRPHDVDDAEVIFIDEINRAIDPKVTNAMLELIQFHSINGEKLPKLRMVCAAQNPASKEEYDVTLLDPALEDRFDLVFEVPPVLDVNYLSTVMPQEVAQALSTWYEDHNKKKMTYISPRRVEKLGHVFLKLGSKHDLQGALPREGNFDLNKLWELLKEATLTEEEREERATERMLQLNAMAGLRGEKAPLTPAASRLLSTIPSLRAMGANGYTNARRRSPEEFKNALEHADNSQRSFLISALAKKTSVDDVVDKWAPVYAKLSDAECKTLITTWGPQRRKRLITALTELPEGALNKRGLTTLASVLNS